MIDINNREWLEGLFDTYYNKIYGFLYAKLKNVALVEDLTSQTFLKVAEKLHTYNEKKGAISTWIFTIALNEMRNYFRSQKGITLANLEEVPELQAENNVEQAVSAKEDKKALYSMLRRLGEREQDTIMLKFFGSMSNKEIAAILGLSETNVGTILSRTLKKMKNMCDEIEKTMYKGIGGMNYER